MDKKDKSVKQEIFIANLFNGSLVSGSGCSQNIKKKGDVRTEIFLIECKTTEKENYTVTKKLLKKIEEEASHINKQPMFVVQLCDDTNSQYCIIKDTALASLLDERRERTLSDILPKVILDKVRSVIESDNSLTYVNKQVYLDKLN